MCVCVCVGLQEDSLGDDVIDLDFFLEGEENTDEKGAFLVLSVVLCAVLLPAVPKGRLR